MASAPFERLADPVVRAIDVAQPVGLVDHYQIPRDDHQFFGMTGGELERADDKHFLFKGLARAILGHLVIIPSLQDQRRKEEFLLDLLRPLFAEIGGCDDKDAPSTLGPILSKDEPGLNGFTQTDLVRKNRTL